MTTAPTCIVAVTGEDGRYDSLLRAARQTAAQAEARLILYDVDAAQMFASPLPTEWSGDGADQQFSELLSAEDLERAGRHPIAEQVRKARADGIEAFGWLPSKKGAPALAEYADKHQADLIMVPSYSEDPSFLDKLRGATLSKLEEETERPIAVVDENGEVTYP